jgi:hypothetical protein
MGMKKGFITLFFTIILLVGCSTDGGRITAKDVLRQKSDADIFQFDGFIYSNITKVEWFNEEKGSYIKQRLIGKIKKQSASSFGFSNFSATKLPIGAKIYSTRKKEKGLDVLIVEYKEKELYYIKLLEG